ncbi:MAG: PHP domain-containing protein, partial [Clostridia bacterium]|nr:PHP domain-containing protein [Clostridia bacterium]
MNKYYYDLHIHSCLSPCADNDNTPNNIAGMASLCGLNIVALTDHNTCKNCPAFFTAAKRYGIIPIAGMELTTSEDIHVICLFDTLNNSLSFDEEINSRRIFIKNRTDIFGDQLILDSDDNVIGIDENLLSNATDVSIDEVPKIVSKYGGICYPAHIDRQANGIIEVLGTFPQTPIFNAVE